MYLKTSFELANNLTVCSKVQQKLCRKSDELTYNQFPDVFPQELIGGFVDDGDGYSSLDTLM